MTEQQLAAVKQALEALDGLYLPGELDRVNKAITALQSIISQDALDKMAENARELGLSYDEEPKIGCVNHDCAQCKAVQEPVAMKPEDVIVETYAIQRGGFMLKPANGVRLIHKPTGTVVQCDSERSQHRNRDTAWRDLEKHLAETTPPAAQPAPLQEPVSEDRSRVLFERHWRKTRGPKKSDRELTRHRLQPQTYIQDSANRHWVTWQAALKATPPAAQKPWVGLTDEEVAEGLRKPFWEDAARAIEAKLKEKNT